MAETVVWDQWMLFDVLQGISGRTYDESLRLTRVVQKQGQKLLAALNLPQVGTITLLGEDSTDGPGLFTIELNERVYTIKARSHEEAAFWVDVRIIPTKKWNKKLSNNTVGITMEAGRWSRYTKVSTCTSWVFL